MAKITVTEHRRLPHDANGAVIPALGAPLAVQPANAAPGASSAQTAAFGVDTYIARVCSDVALHVGYGATATVADDYYPAGAEIIVRVSPGNKLSYLAG
jgi:hypothetical protein